MTYNTLDWFLFNLTHLLSSTSCGGMLVSYHYKDSSHWYVFQCFYVQAITWKKGKVIHSSFLHYPCFYSTTTRNFSLHSYSGLLYIIEGISTCLLHNLGQGCMCMCLGMCRCSMDSIVMFVGYLPTCCFSKWIKWYQIPIPQECLSFYSVSTVSSYYYYNFCLLQKAAPLVGPYANTLPHTAYKHPSVVGIFYSEVDGNIKKCLFGTSSLQMFPFWFYFCCITPYLEQDCVIGHLKYDRL